MFNENLKEKKKNGPNANIIKIWVVIFDCGGVRMFPGGSRQTILLTTANTPPPGCTIWDTSHVYNQQTKVNIAKTDTCSKQMYQKERNTRQLSKCH